MPIKNFENANLEKALYMMDIGDSGYIVPWALSVDPKGFVYLDLTHRLSKGQGGTAKVLVRRNSTRLGDYTVDLMGKHVDIDLSGYDMTQDSSVRKGEIVCIGKIDPLTKEVLSLEGPQTDQKYEEQ